MPRRYPKINFVYSIPLIGITSGVKRKEAVRIIEELKEKTKEFVDIVTKDRIRILRLVEEVTQRKWNIPLLNIYIVKDFSFKGISAPLILKANSTLTMLKILFHELVHIVTATSKGLGLRGKRWEEYHRQIRRQAEKAFRSLTLPKR